MTLERKTLPLPLELVHGIDVELVKNPDGRWTATVPAINGGFKVHGPTREDAERHALGLALHYVADKHFDPNLWCDNCRAAALGDPVPSEIDPIL